MTSILLILFFQHQCETNLTDKKMTERKSEETSLWLIYVATENLKMDWNDICRARCVVLDFQFILTVGFTVHTQHSHCVRNENKF